MSITSVSSAGSADASNTGAASTIGQLEKQIGQLQKKIIKENGSDDDVKTKSELVAAYTAEIAALEAEIARLQAQAAEQAALRQVASASGADDASQSGGRGHSDLSRYLDTQA